MAGKIYVCSVCKRKSKSGEDTKEWYWSGTEDSLLCPECVDKEVVEIMADIEKGGGGNNA